MGDEGFEEWDADFLDQLIQVEELALSSTNPTQHHLPQPPPPRAPPYDEISYSPPRELSQRVRDANTNHLDPSFTNSAPFAAPFRNPNEEEIDRLKRELSRVSKQLTHLEQDCLQLRNERDKKEEQLKSVYSHIEAKDAEVQCRKSKNLEHGVGTHDHPIISPFQNDSSSIDRGGSRDNLATQTCKTVGVQTDISLDSTHLCSKNDLSTHQRCQSKLLAVWDSPNAQESPRNLVSKLLVACETDFHVLFGCLGLPAKASTTSYLAVERSDVGLQDQKPPSQSAEAAKVHQLYSMLTKIGTGMVKLEALFEALVDLCSVKDDGIVYRSLRVLRMVLNHTFDLEMGSHGSVLYSGIMS